jgi:DNA-binding NarL/FixJ family response regulator
MNSVAYRRSSVLVLHSDPLLSAGLVAALREQSAFEVFAVGADRAAADVSAVDVVIADFETAMRLMSATGAGESRPSSQPRVLVLTRNDREADIRRAVQAGVFGYVLTGGVLSELLEGLALVASGVRFLGQSVARRMADSLTHALLTSRELEVLGLVVRGLSNKEIARQLSIEVGTVKSHMMAIMTKLGAASRTQAAGIATARGLVEIRADVLPTFVSPRSGWMGARVQPQAA